MAQKTNKLQRAASYLADARNELRDARMQLALGTRCGDVYHVVDPRWQWAVNLLQRRRPSLLAIGGVVAAELGHRLKAGLLTQEPCITVFVRTKIPGVQLRKRNTRLIPRFVRAGKRRLPIDVVALGELDRHANAGDSIGPAHPARTGTLGAFAVDSVSRRTVAITAMHVSGLNDVSPSAPTLSFFQPSRQDSPTSAAFASLTQGTMRGIDAAKLDVSAQPPAVTKFPDGRIIAGWRPTSFPGDRGTVVHMCGARSGLVSGFIVNPFLPIPSWDLDGAILVNIPSVRGDSGAALIDTSNFLLGFLVGAAGGELDNLRIFAPAGLVFAQLGCDIPTI